MSSRTSRALLALTLSSTLLIAACGGDDPSTTTDGTERIYVSFDETTAQVVLKGGDWALINLKMS